MKYIIVRDKPSYKTLFWAEQLVTVSKRKESTCLPVFYSPWGRGETNILNNKGRKKRRGKIKQQ